MCASATSHMKKTVKYVCEGKRVRKQTHELLNKSLLRALLWGNNPLPANISIPHLGFLTFFVLDLVCSVLQSACFFSTHFRPFLEMVWQLLVAVVWKFAYLHALLPTNSRLFLCHELSHLGATVLSAGLFVRERSVHGDLVPLSMTGQSLSLYLAEKSFIMHLLVITRFVRTH